MAENNTESAPNFVPIEEIKKPAEKPEIKKSLNLKWLAIGGSIGIGILILYLLAKMRKALHPDEQMPIFTESDVTEENKHE
jgi:hypothetical protein